VPLLPEIRRACFEKQLWPYSDCLWGTMAGACDIVPKLTICGALVRNGGRSTAWIDPWDRECFIASASDQRHRVPFALLGGYDDSLSCIYRRAPRPIHWGGSDGLYR